MKLKELTPKKYACVIGACPAIYELDSQECKNDYLIVGKLIDPKSVGLEKKVGKEEVLIKIRKEIIDEKIFLYKENCLKN